MFWLKKLKPKICFKIISRLFKSCLKRFDIHKKQAPSPKGKGLLFNFHEMDA